MSENLFTSDLKTLGLLPIARENADKVNDACFRPFIKVLFLTAGYELQIDLKRYSVERPSLFFVSPDQHLTLEKSGSGQGYFIFYNRDFYCIQIHDDEVACDGLLFNNTHDIPMVALDETEKPFFISLFEQMIGEFGLGDGALEEMIRTYLKQLFIKAVRLWKKQNMDKAFLQRNGDLEFFRKFTRLVEQHYKHKHNVSDYAELLFVAPKTIAHKFKKLRLPQPNDVIKNRIVLEAKRLLVHTNLSTKEIGYKLGYDDPAYFSRLFVQKTGQTTSGFRSKFLAEVDA
ncbi:helix-turn-helix domain-containing protein [Flavobacterium selenitireducens]|uniref:helix-turn-helix domain-containing protein n=1 Tax=Flavobacterium selenitireducens TaxID=2722704 RepID=UPI00168ABFC5|nr:helix-turn-helix domain-containing protein [Flavobacterium selenitireducens]MBD3583564.1 helix-turn-helix domain-containing protein [Flavobacterium selenitireducens]